MKVRKFRVLRQKYGIMLEEVAANAGVSAQRISQMELSDAPYTKQTENMIKGAFQRLIENRLLGLDLLKGDYIEHCQSLFEAVEEDYEL